MDTWLFTCSGSSKRGGEVFMELVKILRLLDELADQKLPVEKWSLHACTKIIRQCLLNAEQWRCPFLDHYDIDPVVAVWLNKLEVQGMGTVT